MTGHFMHELQQIYNGMPAHVSERQGPYQLHGTRLLVGSSFKGVKDPFFPASCLSRNSTPSKRRMMSRFSCTRLRHTVNGSFLGVLCVIEHRSVRSGVHSSSRGS